MHIPTNFNSLLPYMEDEAGNKFQVLNADGDNWDEAATVAQQVAFNNQNTGAPA